MLKFNADGSFVHWEYSPSVARTELCRLIARLDLPLCFGQSDAFQDYITNAHNPRFVKSSRQTTARDLIGLYNNRVEQLTDVLKNSVSSVALTSDIWSGKAKEDYISVVAHFLNPDWCLKKRLLGLKPIEVAHTGVNIAERVEMVASDYGITDKIFAIVLDNASSNKIAIDVLKPVFSGYIGSLMPKPARIDDDLAAVFLHQRCACHIINLIVKSCLKRLKPYLEDFRTAITFLNSSNQRIASYKQYCLSVGVRPQKLLSFLQLFYDSTVALSGVYYPTLPLMLHHILKIARHLNAYENHELLRTAVVPMKTKFLKYWREIPLLYSFAFIIDPRAKMRGFHKVLQKLSVLNGQDYARYPSSIRCKLTKMFPVYESKFGDACLRTSTLPAVSGMGTEAWDDIYGDEEAFAESTFSLASRVLEERRRRLTPDLVEVLSCIKDWELADLHKQHTVEKETKDLEAAFEAMYLDNEEETSPGTKRKEQEGGSGPDAAARKKDKGPATEPSSSRGKRA
ncbi:zinc finger BED domain-containing protein RICESLEEPER 2-like [Panicum virgatum]|uniref:zinc finger BED domain-containing protein RICESLEEPER 2-like n=1 Tax=Panicum virgatum TaxID=38727 RepID=UPI0019D6A602|nr:zinc finger BED domain-containing protein RICESLEEPER 2-like [Panicum virgatum]